MKQPTEKTCNSIMLGAVKQERLYKNKMKWKYYYFYNSKSNAKMNKCVFLRCSEIDSFFSDSKLLATTDRTGKQSVKTHEKLSLSHLFTSNTLVSGLLVCTCSVLPLRNVRKRGHAKK